METSESRTEQNSRRQFNNGTLSRREFSYRVLIIAGVITSFGVLLALFWQSTEVILLVFAGLLAAVFLDGCAEWIGNRLSLSKNWSLVIVLLLIIGVVALIFWFLIPSLQEQIYTMRQQLPAAIERLRQNIEQYSAGSWMLEQLPDNPLELGKQSSNLFGRITGFFSSFLGVAVNVAIVLMAGVYFAFNPNLYYRGVIKLFPKSSQQRVREVLDTLGITLRSWMLGRLVIMTINGTLTALGLWFLGVPLALSLGILTALFNFIPNIGPFLAAAPAILIAFTQSPTQALYTAILFLIVQNLEGFVLTPLVQQRAVSLPPVLIISAQLLLGILFGFLGVLLAVPITAVVFVLIKMLYVEDLLGNQVKVKGEDKARERNETAD